MRGYMEAELYGCVLVTIEVALHIGSYIHDIQNIIKFLANNNIQNYML